MIASDIATRGCTPLQDGQTVPQEGRGDLASCSRCCPPAATIERPKNGPDWYAPDPKAVYLASRNVAAVQGLNCRRMNTAAVTAAIDENLVCPYSQELVDQHGNNAVCIAMRRFPELFLGVQRSDTESQVSRIEDPKPGEGDGRLMKLNDAFSTEEAEEKPLEPEDYPSELDTPATEEEDEIPRKYREISCEVDTPAPEEEELMCLGLDPPVVDEPDSERSKSNVSVADADEAQGLDVCYGTRLRHHTRGLYDRIGVPFASQHRLVTQLQEYLEEACYVYGERKMPNVLRRYGWGCAQAVQLSTCMDEFLCRRETFGSNAMISGYCFDP